MTARAEEWVAAEKRVAACEEVIRVARDANLQGRRFAEVIAAFEKDLSYLQQESFHLWQRMRAQAPGV